MESKKSNDSYKANALLHIPAIEFNITEQCNICCLGCDHAIGIIPSRHISKEDINKDVRRLRQILHAKTIRIIGGEPLLHPNIEEIVGYIGETPIADTIELWTNGILLHKTPQKVLEVINGIVVSRYPEQDYEWTQTTLAKYVNRYNVWIHIRDCNYFTWSYKFQPIGKTPLAEIVYANCREAYTCHTVRNGKFYKCVQAAFAPDRLNACEVVLKDEGVSLHNNPQVIEEIKMLLRCRKPMAACSYCLGEFGGRFRHRKVRTRQLDECLQAEFDANFIYPGMFTGEKSNGCV